MTSKIGVGVITCNRPVFFEKLINSIPDVNNIVVVNDGKSYESTLYSSKVSEVIQHEKNRGIAKTKNEALQYLLDHDCKHIFLFEDDIAVSDYKIFEKYIEASNVSGILHFNYAYHGVTENRTPDGKPNPRLIYEYENDVKLAFYKNTTAALSYFRDIVLKDVGMMDEFYKNALEHVDHTYQIIKAGYHPPFRWFADLADSYKYLNELDFYQKSSLLKKNRFVQKSREMIFNAYFKRKNGYKPGQFPSVSQEEFEKSLLEIKSKYSK